MHGNRNVLPASLVLWLLATPALAQQVSREQDNVDLRLGQRVLVDDGSCPAGQIKEVAGSQMTTSGSIAHPKMHCAIGDEEALARISRRRVGGGDRSL
ncbi:DUF6719 family protein [Bradyrhizobium sp. TZ2]